jgi:hypothetical protein
MLVANCRQCPGILGRAPASPPGNGQADGVSCRRRPWAHLLHSARHVLEPHLITGAPARYARGLNCLSGERAGRLGAPLLADERLTPHLGGPVRKPCTGFGGFGGAFMKLKLTPLGVVRPAHGDEPCFL